MLAIQCSKPFWKFIPLNLCTDQLEGNLQLVNLILSKDILLYFSKIYKNLVCNTTIRSLKLQFLEEWAHKVSSKRLITRSIQLEPGLRSKVQPLMSLWRYSFLTMSKWLIKTLMENFLYLKFYWTMKTSHQLIFSLKVMISPGIRLKKRSCFYLTLTSKSLMLLKIDMKEMLKLM